MFRLDGSLELGRLHGVSVSIRIDKIVILGNNLIMGKKYEKAGQPTRYKPEYCQQLIDYMAQGYLYNAFAGTLSVTSETLYEWEEKHPEFSEAKRVGLHKSMDYDEKLLKAGTLGLKVINGQQVCINPVLLIFKLKNRYPEHYKDKHEITTTSKYEKSTDEQLAELGKLAMEFIKKQKDDTTTL